MKKITLLIALIAFTFNARAQFPETFAEPTNLPAGWEVFDNGIGTTVTWEQDDNGYALILCRMKTFQHQTLLKIS